MRCHSQVVQFDDPSSAVLESLKEGDLIAVPRDCHLIRALQVHTLEGSQVVFTVQHHVHLMTGGRVCTKGACTGGHT